MIRRRRRGGSFKSFLSGANKFLKKSGLLSTLGQIGSQMAPGKYGQMAGVLGNAAGAMGYGRRRRCGGALRLAGGSAEALKKAEAKKFAYSVGRTLRRYRRRT
jgi:hypothetical protein